MNKKVVKAMLALVVIFLVGLYILKIFFPDKFVMVIENERLIAIGEYIDNNQWAYYTFGIVTSFITYSLYFCATMKKWCLNWWQFLVVLAVIGGSIGLSFYDATLTSAFTLICMLMLPILFRGDAKYTLVVFSTHYLAQTLTLLIRNLPMYIQYYNSLEFFMLTLEVYFWLILFYVYPHIKEDKANGMGMSTSIRG